MKKVFKRIVVITILVVMCLSVFCMFSCRPSGKLYSIGEAYRAGLLTEEELQEIADLHNNGRQSEDTLSNKVATNIKKLKAKELREEGGTFRDISYKEISISKFYGKYRNAYVVSVDYGMMVAVLVRYSITVGGATFRFGHPLYAERLLVYVNN